MSKKIVFCVLFSIFAGTALGQSIVVTAPAAGDTWRIGENHVVTWAKTGAMDDEVKVRLIQEGVVALEIADNVPNSGSCPWVIPATVAPGRYVIRVRTMDNAVMDNSDSFTIEAAAAQAPTPADRARWPWSRPTARKRSRWTPCSGSRGVRSPAARTGRRT